MSRGAAALLGEAAPRGRSPASCGESADPCGLGRRDCPPAGEAVEGEVPALPGKGSSDETSVYARMPGLHHFDPVDADEKDLPKLEALQARTLAITGDHDFFPEAIAEHIAHAAPNAELVVLTNCGHFAYLECPAEVRKNIDRFLDSR